MEKKPVRGVNQTHFCCNLAQNTYKSCWINPKMTQNPIWFKLMNVLKGFHKVWLLDSTLWMLTGNRRSTSLLMFLYMQASLCLWYFIKEPDIVWRSCSSFALMIPTSRGKRKWGKREIGNDMQETLPAGCELGMLWFMVSALTLRPSWCPSIWRVWCSSKHWECSNCKSPNTMFVEN